MHRLLVWASLLAILSSCHREAPRPQAGIPRRIVSVTITGDVLLSSLHIPAERVQAVSALADDSGIHEAAGCFPGKPRLGADLEKVLSLAPDLVIVGSFHDPAFLQGLKDAGIPLLQLEDPSSIAKVRTFLHDASRRLGAGPTGDSLVQWMDSTLAAVKARSATCTTPPPTILYWSDGYTAGSQCTLDELFAAAGLRNLGALTGRVRASRIAVEDLSSLDPDWLLFSQWHHQGELPFPEQAKRLRAWRTGRIVFLPGKLLLSTSHRLALAADSLQRAYHRDCGK